MRASATSGVIPAPTTSRAVRRQPGHRRRGACAPTNGSSTPPSRRSASPATTARRSIASPSWPGARGSPSTSTRRARTTCSAGSRRRRPPRCGRRSRRSRTSRPTRAAMPRCWRASHASPTSRLATSRSSGRSKPRRRPTTPWRAARPRSPDERSASSKRGSSATDLPPRLLDPTVELLNTGVISALSRMSILRAAAPEHYRPRTGRRRARRCRAPSAVRPAARRERPPPPEQARRLRSCASAPRRGRSSTGPATSKPTRPVRASGPSDRSSGWPTT